VENEVLNIIIIKGIHAYGNTLNNTNNKDNNNNNNGNND